MAEYDAQHPGTGFRPKQKRKPRISAFTGKPVKLFPETELQVLCVKQYDERARMDRYLRQGTRLFAIAPNDGLQDVFQRTLAQRMGKRAGPFDLIFYDYRRRFRECWIEMKAPKGVLTDEQQDYWEFHARRGAVETHIVRTPDEFWKVLDGN